MGVAVWLRLLRLTWCPTRNRAGRRSAGTRRPSRRHMAAGGAARRGYGWVLRYGGWYGQVDPLVGNWCRAHAMVDGGGEWWMVVANTDRVHCALERLLRQTSARRHHEAEACCKPAKQLVTVPIRRKRANSAKRDRFDLGGHASRVVNLWGINQWNMWTINGYDYLVASGSVRSSSTRTTRAKDSNTVQGPESHLFTSAASWTPHWHYARSTIASLTYANATARTDRTQLYGDASRRWAFGRQSHHPRTRLRERRELGHRGAGLQSRYADVACCMLYERGA